MTAKRFIGTMLGAALLAACATPARTSGNGPREASVSGERMGALCPMAVPGTTVAAEEVEGGAALAFTTSGDVEELRRRVHRMAEFHNQHHGPAAASCESCPHRQQGSCNCPHHGKEGCHCPKHQQGGCPCPGHGAAGHHGGGHHGGGMHGGPHKGMGAPKATATAENIQGGARIVLRPQDPAQLPALREHVTAHARRISQGECPMMPGGRPPPAPSGGDGMHH